MNLASWTVFVLFAAAFVAAARYCLRNGICGGNGGCESCGGSCSGGCGSCRSAKAGACPAARMAERLKDGKGPGA